MAAERTVKVRLTGDVSDFNRALLGASATAQAFTRELNTSNDRATLLTQSILAIGPALVPIGAVGVPAIAGLSNQLAFAGVAAGVFGLAFIGVGRTLKAVNDAVLEPTDANLEKMRQSLTELGPAGAEFVFFLQGLRPQLSNLQDLAREGLLPGAEQGITELMEDLPLFENIVKTVSTTLGDLLAEAGDNLNDERWREFFRFLDAEARPTLTDMGHTLGNFVEGLANLWMAFDPLSDDFSAGFLQMSRDFNEWADGLDQTEGFQEFIDYIETNGPRVADALGSIVNMLVQLVEAAAPVGAASLPVIEAFADGIAALADSDLGPVVIGIISLTAAYSRLIALSKAGGSGALGALFSRTAFAGTLASAKQLPGALLAVESAAERAQTKAGQLSATTTRLGASLRGAGRLAGGAGGLAFVMSDLDDKLGLTNTAMGAMVGSAFPGFGTAIGATVGAVIDLTHQVDQSAEAVERYQQAFNTGNLEQQAAVLKDLRAQVETFNKAQAGGAPGFIDDDAARLRDALDELEPKYEENARAAEDAALAEAGYGDSLAFASDEARAEALAIRDNINAKNEAADAAESAFSAETNYRQALKDAREQARSNSAGIKGNSAAALENREALSKLANGWNRLADAGGKTMAQQRHAKAAFIDAAVGMGVSRAEAKRLADELFHIPKKVTPRVVLEGVAGAVSQIENVRQRLISLDGTTAQTFVQLKESTGQKDGGLVRGYDDGGYVTGPGGPRDDLVNTWLSAGEFVVNAYATSQNRELLEGINSQRYAGGGLVQSAASRDAAPATVIVRGGMTESEFYSAANRLLSQGIRIVGSGGNQRLELMGAGGF